VDVLRQKWVKTRKPHQCYGCLREFPSGTQLHYQSVAADGTGEFVGGRRAPGSGIRPSSTTASTGNRVPAFHAGSFTGITPLGGGQPDDLQIPVVPEVQVKGSRHLDFQGDDRVCRLQFGDEIDPE